MQVRFVYCDPKIYWRSAIIFSRLFDKVISTRRDRSRSRQGSLRSQVCQSTFFCMISGHPVHSTSRRGRCSAQIQPSFRSTIQRWGGANRAMFGYKARLTEDSVVMVETPSKLVADRAKTCGSDPAQMQQALIQLSEWLDRGVTEGRAALDSLRVASRETNDLAVAFDRAILECQQGRELNTQLSVNGIMTALHPVLQDEIFCIGHEAIRNACLHSKGKRLSMESRYRRDLVLEVADDGISIKQTLLHGRAVTLDLLGCVNAQNASGRC